MLLKEKGYIRFPILIDHNNGGFKGKKINKPIKLMTLLILNNNYLYILVIVHASFNVWTGSFSFSLFFNFWNLFCNYFFETTTFFGKTIKAKSQKFQSKNLVVLFFLLFFFYHN